MASAITPTTGSNGSVDGFETTCETCGMVLTHTFESSLQLDAAAHAAYHAGREMPCEICGGLPCREGCIPAIRQRMADERRGAFPVEEVC